jgi:hypothetical protein
MGIFSGERPLIVGVLTYIGVEQGVLYWRYRHAVGEGNTSAVGFREWKRALRQQPRVSVVHGVAGLVAAVALYFVANIPALPKVLVVVLALLVLLSLLYVVANLAHRDPPLSQLGGRGTQPQAGGSQAARPEPTTDGLTARDRADLDRLS